MSKLCDKATENESQADLKGGQQMGNNSKIEKQAKIAEYTQRGVEWCANQLYLSRNTCKNLRAELYHWRYGKRSDSYKISELEDANRTLMKLLKKEGVKAKELIVTYKDMECLNDDYCNGWDCDNECRFYSEHESTETFKFYSWDISDGILNGITKRLEEVANLELVQVIDANSDRVIYENKADDAKEDANGKQTGNM